jgi:hypothetical protein
MPFVDKLKCLAVFESGPQLSIYEYLLLSLEAINRISRECTLLIFRGDPEDGGSFPTICL